MTATTQAKTRRTTKSTAKRTDATPQSKGKAAPAEEAVTEEAVKAPEPKCALSRAQVAKPQAKMLRVISKIGTHPGKALRIKRWDRYAKGMTLQHCKETEGLDHLDVLFYVEHGLMELREPTEKEVSAAVEAWEKARKAQSEAA